MNTNMMTIKDVAAYLRLTEKTAYRLAAECKILGFKVRGSWRFWRSKIEKWIDEQSDIRMLEAVREWAHQVRGRFWVFSWLVCLHRMIVF